MTAEGQIQALLQISRKEQATFAKLPLAQKRQVARKNLRSMGITTKNGKLAPAFK